MNPNAVSVNYLYLGSKPLNYSDDRLGSNVSGMQYYPYGQVQSGTALFEAPTFGTYVQDESWLLYADQRYLYQNWGRFLTADPSDANIDATVSVSFNRHMYVNGDPLNLSDPNGTDIWCTAPDGENAQPSCSDTDLNQSVPLPNPTSITVYASPDVNPYDASQNPPDIGVSGNAPISGSQGSGGSLFQQVLTQPPPCGGSWGQPCTPAPPPPCSAVKTLANGLKAIASGGGILAGLGKLGIVAESGGTVLGVIGVVGGVGGILGLAADYHIGCTP